MTTEVVAEVLVMVLALALAIVASGSSATLPDGIRLGLLALATGAFLLAVLRREGLL